MDYLIKALHPNNLRPSLSMMTPNETLFRTMDEVPNYTDKILVWFLLLVFLEFILSGRHSLNDTLTNLNSSALYLVFKFGGRSVSAVFYEYLYYNFAIYHFEWNSYYAWFLGFLTTDLAFYFSHRAQHEIGIFWAFHQFHHSSEYYNLSISMRLGIVQDLCASIFELMQAIIIPPPIFLVHRYFLALHMFWVHADFIPSLGWLEYIIVTPNTHKVHHGRNKYCIDKNYSGTLIIWDIMFGTFTLPKEDEEIAYGLVKPVSSFDQIWIQIFEFKTYLWDKGHSKDKDGKEIYPGFFNKLKAILLPPPYQPGDKTKQFYFWRSCEDPVEHFPDESMKDVTPFNPPMSVPLKTYLVFNAATIVYGALLLEKIRIGLSWPHFFLGVGLMLSRLQMFGYYMDHRWFATQFDISTLAFLAFIARYYGALMSSQICFVFMTFSVLLAWGGFTPKNKAKIA